MAPRSRALPRYCMCGKPVQPRAISGVLVYQGFIQGGGGGRYNYKIGIFSCSACGHGHVQPCAAACSGWDTTLFHQCAIKAVVCPSNQPFRMLRTFPLSPSPCLCTHTATFCLIFPPWNPLGILCMSLNV